MVALSSQPFDNSKFVLDTKEWYGHFLLKKNLLCVQCDFSFHPKCVKSSSAKHGYHRHLLICMESIKEDNFGEYHCDVCENERNLKHLVYYCPSWRYMAHVECALADPPCYACPFALKSLMFAYNCEHCLINLHPTCASSLRRPLKSESHGHMHDLYYFGTNFQLLIAKYPPPAASFLCAECGKHIKREPFYCCPQCRFNFHVKCIPIPDMVKSTYHDHVLTLKGSFVEDDSRDHRCEFCEEDRNPNDHAYYCEDCNGQVIAHVECVFEPFKSKDKILFCCGKSLT
ncbi:hypothetical protein V6Z11_D11G282700 [Gossypium hirsutum]|nr:hypothetical protein ES332_D11G295500v1 [Gossypium tomentosum]